MKQINKIKYKNTLQLLLGIMAAVLLSRSTEFHDFLINLGGIGYLGAVIGGMMFVLTFTVATGILILVSLANELSAIPLALAAGFGAVLGDLMIFNYVKDGLSSEMMQMYKKFGGHVFPEFFGSKYFKWALPIIGALIIISPFPDEIGVGLMGLSGIKPINFILLSFVLNSVGILLLVSIATSFRQ